MSATAESGLPAEDAKLVTLARSARSRASSREGAAVRDDIGRTYAAATVGLRSLRLSALQAAVAAAVSSGSDVLEAVVVVTDSDQMSEHDLALVDEVGAGVVLLATPRGDVTVLR